MLVPRIFYWNGKFFPIELIADAFVSRGCDADA